MKMQTSEMKLDGNAIAGLLGEIFAVEMTTAHGTCASCGAGAGSTTSRTATTIGPTPRPAPSTLSAIRLRR